MTIQTDWLHHLEPIHITMPRLYVVSWLADANGYPVAADKLANAVFIKTELHDNEDAAWSQWDSLATEGFTPAFASCQDWTGESIV